MIFALDAASLYLATAVVGGVTSLFLWTAWRRERTAFAAYGAGYFALAALGLLSMSFRALGAEGSLIALAPAALLLSLSFLLAGTRSLRERRTAHWIIALPALCFLGFFLLPLGASRSLWVGAAYCITAGSLLVAGAWNLWCVYGQQRLKAARDLALVLGVGGTGWYLFRLAQLASAEYLPLTAASGLVSMLLVTASSAIVIALVRESAVSRKLVTLLGTRADIDRLLAGLPAVIFLREASADGTSRLLYRGGDLAAVTGWPAAYVAKLDDLTTLAEPGSSAAAWRNNVLDAEGVSYEFRIRQPDGGWRWMSSSVRILERRADGSTLVVGYAVSIDALRAADARAAASSRLSLLGDMGMGLAHELQQPLQALSLAAEIAQVSLHEGRVEVIEPQLQSVVEEAARAAAIINHLRRFARGGDGKVTLKSVRLRAAVEGTLAIIRGALERDEISLEVCLDGAPEFVLCDAVPLEQVLVNLLLNARDALASLPAGAPRRIRVAAGAEGGNEVWISVADTGGGIPDSILGRIFEPFFTTKGPDRGTGLGLSVSYGLMMGMGGRIKAANDGSGAVLTIVLQAANPVDRDAPPAV
jgi:signal transduction histidine kinase